MHADEKPNHSIPPQKNTGTKTTGTPQKKFMKSGATIPDFDITESNPSFILGYN